MGTPRRVATARARHAHGTRHAAGGESNGSHGRAEAGERQGRSRHRRSARASATRTFSVPRRHTTRTRRTTTPQRGSRPDACLHSRARVPCGLHGLRIRPPAAKRQARGALRRRCERSGCVEAPRPRLRFCNLAQGKLAQGLRLGFTYARLGHLVAQAPAPAEHSPEAKLTGGSRNYVRYSNRVSCSHRKEIKRILLKKDVA